MKRTAQIISGLALAATLLPSVLYLLGKTPLDTVKTVMLGATVVWFATAPIWMERKAR